ncbi:MAG: helix-turn-helix domain-containing protein [Chloroflexota bacterium]|nr:helix-turn-helix domain-containing protein [Chloroflexota bacterium]
MARALYDGKLHSVAEICQTLGISRATRYRYVAVKPTDAAPPR